MRRLPHLALGTLRSIPSVLIARAIERQAGRCRLAKGVGADLICWGKESRKDNPEARAMTPRLFYCTHRRFTTSTDTGRFSKARRGGCDPQHTSEAFFRIVDIGVRPFGAEKLRVCRQGSSDSFDDHCQSSRHRARRRTFASCWRIPSPSRRPGSSR